MSAPLTVAIDLGGTHLRGALVEHDGTIVRRDRWATPSADEEPTALVKLIDEVSKGYDVSRAVIGLPGVIDHDAETLVHAPNLPPSWVPLLTDAWLTRRTGLDVALANDCDLAAVGEATFGAGQSHRDVVYVTISTGVGAGIVLGSKLMRGRYSGGEIGHTIIDRDLTAAGGDGTVEGLGSGTALGKAQAAAGLDPASGYLTDLVRAGDEAANEVFTSGIEAAALGVVNLCWIVSPQMVVIGGGVGMHGDLVLPIVERMVQAHGPRIGTIDVVNAELGDDAALVGAAAWWEAIGRES
ncbi:MAG: ROK family protein [Acidimicrobiales bacterium]